MAKENIFNNAVRTFKERYAEEILPKLLEHENEIKVGNITVLTAKILSVIPFLCIVVIFIKETFIYQHQTGIFPYLIPILQFSFIFAVALFYENKLKNKLNGIIAPVLFASFDNMIIKRRFNKNSEKQFYDAGFIHGYNIDGNVLEAKYKGNEISIGEARIIYKSKEPANKYDHEITADGILIRFEVKRKFKCRAVIKSDFLKWNHPVSLWRTKMEYGVFEKKYEVFCDDEIEVRKLVTPVFMERMLDLYEKFNATIISCAFYEDSFLIALGTNRQIIDVKKLMANIDDYSVYADAIKQITSIINLYDYLKLE